MVFSSVVFIFLFLPVVLLLYYISPVKLRNLILLLCSIFFYAWGEPKYVILMIISITVNYFSGLLINKYKDKASKQVALGLTITVNIAILGYYKYINFIIDNINVIFNLSINNEPLPLPIGISFYTFQAVSYLIDVYRNDARVQKNPLDLALYISLFPQLIAGPIVRYTVIQDQIKNRVFNFNVFSEGTQRFMVGLAKKVIIANPLGLVADNVFSQDPSEISILLAWVGILAFTLQIYFDFSGYSDMAIGLGKMFGFHFNENFNFPYISKSISEFWRRWHISLGSWFRDYVYIPLGGNKVSRIKMYRNLFIVWALTGIWHGASWTFICWGLYFGLIIAIEKAGFEKIIKKMWTPLQHAYALLLVMIGWVFFRADNFLFSIDYLKTMFWVNHFKWIDNATYLLIYDNMIVFLIAIIFSTPLISVIAGKISEIKGLVKYNWIFNTVIYSAILFLTISYVVKMTYNPFLYFRF
ncbi:MBOAT family O-acyltransferase [Bacillus alkalicellulosilyticus]|uniref:MBOAT family O-acyltransferase n=1 Tax=Alkalihalobacterium alkalicellulosilyticum TaxID=1912214 RepID=UPI00099674EE|nr:MBOAT family O-acyltransferase [Bacillus alkalicellulosilyticus]